MIRSFLCVFVLSYPSFAEDAINKELQAAKKEHFDRITIIRQNAIDDFKDKIIDLQNQGVVPNFMIKELDAFKEKGIVPITPQLLKISNKYLAEKKKADEELEAAYTKAREAYVKANKPDYALLIKVELKKLRATIDELNLKAEELKKSGSAREPVQPSTDNEPLKTRDPIPAVKLPDQPSALPRNDPLRLELLEATDRFQQGLREFDRKIQNQLAVREEKIRNAANVRSITVDAFKLEKQRYTERGELPLWIPTEIAQQRGRLFADLEQAYLGAIKKCLKDREDTKAAILENELTKLWAATWSHVSYEKAKLKDGYLHLPPNTAITTKEQFAGPLDVQMIARTENDNIRFSVCGCAVILNWEVNKSELRVHRLIGGKDQVATAKVTPLAPNKWYAIRWHIHPKGMALYCNGNLLWSERQSYELEKNKSVLTLLACESAIDVKELLVRPIIATGE